MTLVEKFGDISSKISLKPFEWCVLFDFLYEQDARIEVEKQEAIKTAVLAVLDELYEMRDRVEKPDPQQYKSRWGCEIFPAVAASNIEEIRARYEHKGETK